MSGGWQHCNHRVLTQEEWRVERSLQYNHREDEWGVSTVRCVKEWQYR